MLKYNVNQAKNFFFDRQKVINAMSRARAKALSKVGAFVRTRARTSIKKARRMKASEMSPAAEAQYQRRRAQAKREGRPAPKRPFASSKPGEPPRSVLGHLKKGILYGYDPQSESVVIGPARLNGRADPDAPRTLETGGNARVGNRTVAIAARPYMRPALHEEIAAGTIPPAFRNTVKGP